MSVDNTRFNLAWLSVVLFIAVAIILGFLNMPMMACVGVFFLGLGAVLAALGALVGKPENMLIGGGAALAIVGSRCGDQNEEQQRDFGEPSKAEGKLL